MTKHTYTVNFTFYAEAGRTTETRAFYSLREAMDFVRANNNAAGYVLRQHYTHELAPACGNDLIKFFGGIEKRLSASEQSRLTSLCGTCAVLPTGYATAGETVKKVLVTGASLIIPAFAASGLDKTAVLVRKGNVFRLAYLYQGGAARFRMTGETN